MKYWVPPRLSGFVCAFHPVALGSSHKHTIYAFIIYSENCAIFSLHFEENETNKKRLGLAHF